MTFPNKKQEKNLNENINFIVTLTRSPMRREVDDHFDLSSLKTHTLTIKMLEAF